jgi:hypothetical protein
VREVRILEYSDVVAVFPGMNFPELLSIDGTFAVPKCQICEYKEQLKIWLPNLSFVELSVRANIHVWSTLDVH